MEWGRDQKFGVAAREETAKLTGRQILQAMIDGRLPAPPISRILSFRPVEVGDGFAVFEGEPGPDLLNPLGSVHGGWTLALIESATAAAVHSTLPAGRSFATDRDQGQFHPAHRPRDRPRPGRRPRHQRRPDDRLGRGQDRRRPRTADGPRDLDGDGFSGHSRLSRAPPRLTSG